MTVFQNPAPPDNGPDLDDVAATLDANAGQWAILLSDVNGLDDGTYANGIAWSVENGSYAIAFPPKLYQAVTARRLNENSDPVYDIYVRKP